MPYIVQNRNDEDAMKNQLCDEEDQRDDLLA